MKMTVLVGLGFDEKCDESVFNERREVDWFGGSSSSWVDRGIGFVETKSSEAISANPFFSVIEVVFRFIISWLDDGVNWKGLVYRLKMKTDWSPVQETQLGRYNELCRPSGYSDHLSLFTVLLLFQIGHGLLSGEFRPTKPLFDPAVKTG